MKTVSNSRADAACVAPGAEIPGEWASAAKAEGAGGGVWVRLVEKYGEYPATITMRDGSTVQGVQVIDKEGCEEMVAAFNSFTTRAAFLWRGLPLLEGHPDDRGWARTNEVDKNLRAVGRIKRVEARDDAPWALIVLNSDGENLVGGEAPAYTAISARFGVEPVPGRPERQRVVRLFSAGLTNTPNLPGTEISVNAEGEDEEEIFEEEPNEPTEDTMNPELLARLGLSAESTPEEVEAAVSKLLDEIDAMKAAAPNMEDAEKEKEKAVAAANAARDAAITTVCNAAVADGRITAAELPAWENALKSDFIPEAEKLAKKMPNSAVNSKSALGDLGGRKSGSPEGERLAAKMAGYAKEHNLDLSKREDYNKAAAHCL